MGFWGMDSLLCQAEPGKILKFNAFLRFEVWAFFLRPRPVLLVWRAGAAGQTESRLRPDEAQTTVTVPLPPVTVMASPRLNSSRCARPAWLGHAVMAEIFQASDRAGKSPSAPDCAGDNIEFGDAGDTGFEGGADPILHEGRDVAVGGIAFRCHSAAFGQRDRLRNFRQMLISRSVRPSSPPSRAANKRAMHDQIGIAADRRSEMGIFGQVQVEMPDMPAS